MCLPLPGADHDALYRVPRPHLLQLLRLPQREGQRGPRRQQELQQLRGRPLVGRGQYLSVLLFNAVKLFILCNIRKVLPPTFIFIML